jgi:hypothetical protein
VISPIPLGLDGAAVSSASPRLPLESSSPETILGHKSTCSESQLLGSPDIAVLNTLLLRATARRSTPPFGGVLPLTKLTHFRRESRPGRAAVDPGSTSTDPHRPPQWGSVGTRRGFRGSARGAVLNRRFRAEAAPLPWGADPTGEAAPGLGPGLCESAGRCAGRWSQP